MISEYVLSSEEEYESEECDTTGDSDDMSCDADEEAEEKQKISKSDRDIRYEKNLANKEMASANRCGNLEDGMGEDDASDDDMLIDVQDVDIVRFY